MTERRPPEADGEGNDRPVIGSDIRPERLRDGVAGTEPLSAAESEALPVAFGVASGDVLRMPESYDEMRGRPQGKLYRILLAAAANAGGDTDGFGNSVLIGSGRSGISHFESTG